MASRLLDNRHMALSSSGFPGVEVMQQAAEVGLEALHVLPPYRLFAVGGV